jgi:mannose-1-phosphate guanylyltransferase
LSRKERPKQFYPLFSGKSLFQETVRRNAELCPRVFLAAGDAHLTQAFQQLSGLSHQQAAGIAEPVGRNTAPAIALACLTMDPQELVLVTPSDHVILREEAYKLAVAQAAELARQGRIVTFGLKASHPETGFGYIQPEGTRVVAFFEKPTREKAEDYLRRGFLWNSGMFLFQAGVFLDELGQHAPEVLKAARAVVSDWALDTSAPVWRPSLAQMQTLPSISIDHAVMEKTSKSSVVACDIGWSDLGSFDALYEELDKDDTGNVLATEQEPVLVDAHNNLVVTGRMVALVGVRDLFVIDTNEALLIVQKGKSQEVKKVVEMMTSRENCRGLL